MKEKRKIITTKKSVCMHVVELYTHQLYYLKLNKWEKQLDSMITTEKRRRNIGVVLFFFHRFSSNNSYRRTRRIKIYIQKKEKRKQHIAVFGLKSNRHVQTKKNEVCFAFYWVFF
jgi:predicted type IV restriction endonuclease